MQIQATSLQPLPEGENENSPGWSAAEPWESIPLPDAPSRRDGRNLPTHVTRIVFDAVLVEKGNAGFKIINADDKPVFMY
jgi:hypothetical protein